jgi:hypothetical protein
MAAWSTLPVSPLGERLLRSILSEELDSWTLLAIEACAWHEDRFCREYGLPALPL